MDFILDAIQAGFGFGLGFIGAGVVWGIVILVMIAAIVGFSGGSK